MGMARSRAKAKTTAKHKRGPFLAAAVFCESITQDRADIVSVIKIHDGIVALLPSDAELPTKEKPLHLLKHMLIALKSGDSPGTHKLKIQARNPDGTLGKPTTPEEQDFTLPDEPHGGVNITTNIALSLYRSGVFWFDIIVDGKLMTSIPLLVEIKQEEATPPQPLTPRKPARK